MVMLPQDQAAMVAKATRMVAELDAEARATMAALIPEQLQDLSDGQQSRLARLGLVERRLDRPRFTELGQIVYAALTAGSARGTRPSDGHAAAPAEQPGSVAE